jgi:hypothetical protein
MAADREHREEDRGGAGRLRPEVPRRPAGRALGWLWLALALAAAPALANDPEPVAADPLEPEDAGTLAQAEEDAQRARSYGELVEARIYGGSDFVVGGDFDEFRASSYQPGGRIKVTLPVASNAAVRVVARGSALFYDFDDVSSNLFGGVPTSSDPFGNLYASSLQIQGGMQPGWSGLFSEDERWSLLAEVAGRARWESGASFGSSIGLGGAVGVGYQLGGLQLIVGAGVSSRVDGGGISAHPVIDVDWRFAERWRLRSRGRGAELEYAIRDGLTVYASGQLASRSYLLADRGPGIGEGRLRESSVPVGLGVRWDVSPLVELDLSAGALLRYELETEDEDGTELGHARAGPTPFIGITLALKPDRAREVAAAKRSQRASLAGSSSTSISTSR